MEDEVVYGNNLELYLLGLNQGDLVVSQDVQKWPTWYSSVFVTSCFSSAPWLHWRTCLKIRELSSTRLRNSWVLIFARSAICFSPFGLQCIARSLLRLPSCFLFEMAGPGRTRPQDVTRCTPSKTHMEPKNVWKIIFLFKGANFRFYISFPHPRAGHPHSNTGHRSSTR